MMRASFVLALGLSACAEGALGSSGKLAEGLPDGGATADATITVGEDASTGGDAAFGEDAAVSLDAATGSDAAVVVDAAPAIDAAAPLDARIESDATVTADAWVAVDARVEVDAAVVGDPTADPDGDYLTNAEEASRGTDPARADTDGDGYLDGDEVLMSKDPTSSASRIYQGGWPFDRNKGSITPTPLAVGSCMAGSIAPRFNYQDQFNESVDLYDYAHHGTYTIVELGGPSCGRCRYVTSVIGGMYDEAYLSAEMRNLKRFVDSGRGRFISFMTSDFEGGSPDTTEAARYAEEVPNTAILVVDDYDPTIWLGSWSSPAMIMMDENMQVVICSGTMESFLSELLRRFPS